MEESKLEVPDVKAKREKTTQFAGIGCVIQGLGLITPIVLGLIAGIPGAIAGILIFIVLFFVGSAKSASWRCGNCKNPIADGKVRICPTCKAHFE